MCASTGGAGGSFSTPTGRPRSTGPTAKSSTATHHRPPAQTDPGAGITAIGCDSCAQCGPTAATAFMGAQERTSAPFQVAAEGLVAFPAVSLDPTEHPGRTIQAAEVVDDRVVA